MKRKITWLFLFLFIFFGLNLTAFGQENDMFFVDVQKDKIVLCWAISDWKDVSGFNIYRRSAKGEWQRLNDKAITRLKSVDEIIKMLGPDEAGVYLSLFGIKGNVVELDDATFYKLMGTKNGWQWVGAFGLLYPKISKALGLLYEDGNISEGIKYNYKVTRVSISGTELDIFETTRDITAGEVVEVAKPIEFEARAGDGKAFFKWKYDIDFNKKNYIASYNLYRKDDKEADFKKANNAPIFIMGSKTPDGRITFPEDLYVDNGLVNGNKYVYKMTSVNAVGRESNFTNEVLIEPKDLTPPNPPVNLSSKIKDSEVIIEWEANKEKDLTGYNIYRSLKPEDGYDKINEKTLTENQFIDKNLKTAVIYWYRISSIDTSGNESHFSAGISVLAVDKIPPQPPIELKAQSETGKIILAWKANAEPDLAGYKLYRATKEDGDYLLLNQEPVKENKYIDTLPETSQTTYWYKVRAIDTSFNESDHSQAIKARLPDKIAPRAPTLFKSFSKNEEILIEWLPNPEKDLAGYNIYRKNEPDGKNNKLNNELIAKDKKEFKDKNVIHQKKLYYSLTAVDESENESVPSKEIAIIGFDETPPSPPAGLSVKSIKDGIILSWEKNKESDLNYYSLYRKEDKEFVKIASDLGTEEYIDREVKDKTSYYYYVTASDSSNNESKGSKEVEIKLELNSLN